MTTIKYLAPDGGWGWVVVFGFALNNFVMIPIMQGFGMIYGETFKQLGISATEATLIININQAFGMILGLMNGPLLRKYGYRKMALLGGHLYSAGIILTSFATSFVHFVFSYGMIASLGMGITMASCQLAINTYFKEKRSRAVGMSMTITALGSIIVPHLTSLLLPIYDSKGTMLILGGMSLHGIVGALILHPIKWHAKRIESTLEFVENEIDKEDKESIENYDKQEIKSLIDDANEKFTNDSECDAKKRIRRRSRTMTMSSADFNDDNTSVYGFEMQTGSLLDIRDWNFEDEDSNLRNEDNKKFFQKNGNSDHDYKRSNSINEGKSRKFSTTKYGDLGLSSKILFECPEEDGELAKNDDEYEKEKSSKPLSSSPLPKIADPPPMNEKEKPKEKNSLPIRIFKRAAKYFDLGLLCDPVYVNIMFGMSLAIFAEFNFSVLTPFILADMRLTIDGIAMMMSVLASSDLLLRALAPYIGEWLRKPPRVMYLISLLFLIVMRSALLFVQSYMSILMVSIGLGIAKGLRSVYMVLVIPSYVPLERLAAASSIQSLVNGFFLISAGPFLGFIRDITGSYVFCIIFLNFITAMTIILWLAEFAYKRIKKRRKFNKISR